MVFEITWTGRGALTYRKNIEYLQKVWTEKEIVKFKNEYQYTAGYYQQKYFDDL